jgi:hypothetical protein
MIPIRRTTAVVAAVLGAAAGCAPELNWREVRPEGVALVALLPCKPDRQTRAIPLAGAEVSMEVLGCSAGGTTWAVATADVGDPARVAPALAGLRAARARNLEGHEGDARAAEVAGATPGALRLTVEGRRPDGTPVSERALLFAQGTRVFHAAALGGQPSTEALEVFFGGLKLAR